MLGGADAAATIPASDLERAKRFYNETLGLSLVKESKGGAVYASGNSKVFVYKTEFAGTNKATTASWTVDNVESVASELTSKGIKLEHYDIPGVTRQGDVHILGELKAIWFKDTEGNILSVANGMG